MKEIVDKLFDELEYNDFFSYRDATDFAYDNNLQFNSGASKFVFTKPEWNHVIKMPRVDCQDFIDCIDLEIENYKIAKKMGIETILMPNSCVGWMEFQDKTVKIYQQPKYTRPWDLFDSELADVIKKRMLYNWNEIHKIKGNFFGYGCLGLDDAWIGRIVQLYGMNFLRRVAEWTNECAVDDLHAANYGVLGHKPVIIDYAGYLA